MPDAQQAAFRAVLNGFARPGTFVPAQVDGAGAVLMFLSAVLDESVSLADPHALLSADVRRMLLAPSAQADQARFVLLDGRQPPDAVWKPALGTLESPELGATLVLKVDSLGDAAVALAKATVGLRLNGPGVPGTRLLTVTGLDRRWLAQRAAWVGAFPMGVDFVLAAPRGLVALPRTTRIAIEPAAET